MPRRFHWITIGVDVVPWGCLLGYIGYEYDLYNYLNLLRLGYTVINFRQQYMLRAVWSDADFVHIEVRLSIIPLARLAYQIYIDTWQ